MKPETLRVVLTKHFGHPTICHKNERPKQRSKVVELRNGNIEDQIICDVDYRLELEDTAVIAEDFQVFIRVPADPKLAVWVAYNPRLSSQEVLAVIKAAKGQLIVSETAAEEVPDRTLETAAS